MASTDSLRQADAQGGAGAGLDAGAVQQGFGAGLAGAARGLVGRLAWRGAAAAWGRAAGHAGSIHAAHAGPAC
jgi:hypothetical protein